ncbi:MAG TPA: hypothetical protein H9804_05230, partial [Candidatus Mucispirillum faecigallinarum]|nr:hypothetical protein [Candidatus Mucispirillum faecigallinarum]
GQKMYAVGIANNDAQVKNVLSGKPLFNNEEELMQYEIGNNVDVVYVTVDNWKILNETEQSSLSLTGLQDRIILLSDGKYNQLRSKILTMI